MNLDNLTPEEIRKKAELYEKLRRISPREFMELYIKNVLGKGSFDELLEKWPESNENNTSNSRNNV